MKSLNGRRSSFEPLEDRNLLAGDVYATAPIADVRQLATMYSPRQLSESDLRLALLTHKLLLRQEETTSIEP